jgi:putative transposase
MTDQNSSYYHQPAHAPAHLFIPNSTYIVTASTYNKEPLFGSFEKRDFLLETLFEEMERFGWGLQAWAIMSNHYHIIARAPERADSLKRVIASLHSKTAIWLNRAESVAGRKVWFGYWDTCLTSERSYLARLHYVHNNPVKHHLTVNAEEYRWCSMAWFVARADPAFQRTVFSFKIDQVHVEDSY